MLQNQECPIPLKCPGWNVFCAFYFLNSHCSFEVSKVFGTLSKYHKKSQSKTKRTEKWLQKATIPLANDFTRGKINR